VKTLLFGNNESIEIGKNYIYLNSTAIPSLNKSAILTLDLTGLGITSPIILKDGVECVDCNLISYIGEVITFNVTGFSNYTIGEPIYKTEKEEFRDDTINVFRNLALFIGLLILIAMISFGIFAYLGKGEEGIDNKFDGGILIKVVSIAVGVLIMCAVAIFVVYTILS